MRCASTVVAVGFVLAVAGSAVAPAQTMAAHHSAASADLPHGQAKTTSSGPSGGGRQLVRLPAAMQQHMLANMRDHLATLSQVIGDVAAGKFDAASKLAEARLGMSSLKLHHAAEMAPYFPKPMQEVGTSMHHAASRLAIVLQNAGVAEDLPSLRAVDTVLHQVTTNCVACHASYRIR